MYIQDRPERLPRPVNIRPYNRPILIAYLVPVEEGGETHWILDAVFSDAYSRWGGALSLVVPIQDGRPISALYLEWLEVYEPDIIYSYVDLDVELIGFLARNVMPIEIVRHESYRSPERWRDFCPRYPAGVNPVKSMSTYSSPLVSRSVIPGRTLNQVLLAQYESNDESRFLPDNFGVDYDTSYPTTNLHGVGPIKCFCPSDLPDNHYVGHERSSSLTDIIADVYSGNIRTFSTLSSTHIEGINHPDGLFWAKSFQLFIGKTVADRIGYWNARVLCRARREQDLVSLIVSPELISDDEVVHHIRELLNRRNHSFDGGGQAKVQIRSYSVSREECELLAGRLRSKHWGQITVPDDFDALVLPDATDNSSRLRSKGTAVPAVTARESAFEYVVSEPDHYKYLPPELGYLKGGQWAVEFEIERYQSDFRYINVLNDWKVPRRYEVLGAFTRNLAKITASNNVVALPASHEWPSIQQQTTSRKTVYLSIPDDETVFRNLVCGNHSAGRHDLLDEVGRSNRYQDLGLSDKGQLHRGVLSHFEDSVNQAAVLTNRFWRKFIDESWADKDLSYSLDNLKSKINNLSSVDLAKTLEEFRLNNDKQAKKYLRENLRDVLQRFVHKKIVMQLYTWRCKKCGKNNCRSLDTLRIKNQCEVCKTIHFTPIDMDWQYQLSPFVCQALAEHDGMLVLWAAARLSEESNLGQQIYLPQVDLYRTYDDPNSKNEVDLLGIYDGKFVMMEGKKSAASFVVSEREKGVFIDEVERLRPDIAYLVFEQYCDNQDEAEEFKARLWEVVSELGGRVPAGTKIECIVTSDVGDFTSFPAQLGPDGDRSYYYLESLEE